MKDFRRLDVWHLSIRLVTNIYEASSRFPGSERFGLTSQIRRAAVSIPSNIAEGSGRDSQRDLARFLGYARGSSAEVECQLVIAHRLGFLEEGHLGPLLAETQRAQRMLSSLIRKLRVEATKTTPA
ncbi:MAG: four helix bundle protein [Acidimicrobiia bacterium]|nr:four helix bundle protein [Acidimicrobiia bacterium]